NDRDLDRHRQHDRRTRRPDGDLSPKRPGVGGRWDQLVSHSRSKNGRTLQSSERELDDHKKASSNTHGTSGDIAVWWESTCRRGSGPVRLDCRRATLPVSAVVGRTFNMRDAAATILFVRQASNQSMKPTLPFGNTSSVFAMTPCRGLSLFR